MKLGQVHACRYSYTALSELLLIVKLAIHVLSKKPRMCGSGIKRGIGPRFFGKPNMFNSGQDIQGVVA